MASPDASLPIIDAHHHFWDLSLRAQPWLVEEPWIAFRYGDYSTIRQDFLVRDYLRVSAGHNVVATVTMEGEWAEERLVEETEWTSELHRHDARFPAAHVARTFLHTPSAPEELAQHARHPFVKGVRHKPAAAPSPDRIVKGAAGGMTDPNWRRGYAGLGANGLHFELQAPWWHVEELLDLVAAFPETPVVINHAFMPADRSPDAMAGWRKAVALAATAPQISMKISGIGCKGRAWSLADNRDIIRFLIDSFGPERCMFASNFPVDGICGSFDTIFSGFKQATADLAPDERLKLFHDNAIRIYRLDIPRAGA